MDKYRASKRSYVSKIRRITACSECHRRKQKCNRQRPCSGCVTRGWPERCIYGAANSSHEFESPDSSRDVISDDWDLTMDESQQSAVSNNLGYVRTNENGPLNASNPSALIRLHSQNRSPSSVPLSPGQDDKFSELLSHVPEPSLTRRLVNVFFSHANWYFSVLDQCFFDQRHRTFLVWYQSNPRRHADHEICYFTALMLQVIAMALHFLAEADKIDPILSQFLQPTADAKSQVCSEASDFILVLLNRRHPTLSSIEADIMRCAWLKNSGHGLDSWHSLSNAVRQAQDLRLHLEPISHADDSITAENLQEAWHYEHKRRIWACLLTWEAHMALQLGRPRMINISDCTVRGPTSCDAPNDTTRTLLRDCISSDIPPHYTSHVVKYKIALMIHRAMNTGLLRPGKGQKANVRSMHLETEQLLSKLHPAFRHPEPDTSWDVIDPDVPKLRLQIQIVVESFLLALHRPHIFTDPNSLKFAVWAAKKTLDLSQELFQIVEENQHKTFTLVFYTIDSGMFLAVALAKFHHSEDSPFLALESFIETLESSIRRLAYLEKVHTVATAGKGILRKCVDHLKAPSNSQRPNHPQKLPTPSPATISQYDSADMNTPMTFGLEGNDDFWTNWLNDSAFTAAWLDEQLDPSIPSFNPFGENASPWPG